MGSLTQARVIHPTRALRVALANATAVVASDGAGAQCVVTVYDEIVPSVLALHVVRRHEAVLPCTLHHQTNPSQRMRTAYTRECVPRIMRV